MNKATLLLKNRFGNHFQVEWFDLIKNNDFSVSTMVNNWYKGPTSFNQSFINFGSFFAKDINSTISNQSYKDEKKLTIISKKLTGEKKIIFKKNAEIIKKIANTKKITKSLAQKYLNSLKILTKYVIPNSDLLTKDNTKILVPMRGAAIVIYNLPFKKTLKNNLITIDCKRLPLKNKKFDFGFGMRFEIDQLKNKYNQLVFQQGNKKNKFVIVEIASASGITVSGMLLDMYMRGVRNMEVEIISLFMSKQFYETLKSITKTLGFNISFKTGVLVNRLGNFYEEGSDSLLYEDGSYAIGNATEILSSFMYDISKEIL